MTLRDELPCSPSGGRVVGCAWLEAPALHGLAGTFSVPSVGEKQTEQLGCLLAERVSPGAVLCLLGDLGVGKTVFARGFARGSGITEPVTSPTFTLVNSYEGRMADGSRRTLHHFDLYRIADEEELLDIGWDEYLDGEAVLLVEWPDRAGSLLPSGCLQVEILRSGTGTEERIITLGRKGDAI